MRRDKLPEIDESHLTEAQRREIHKGVFNWKWGVFWGVILALMAFCIIMILVLG